MPTPSETRPGREWSARTDGPRRSVFGNYRAERSGPGEQDAASVLPEPQDARASEPLLRKEQAVARAFIYRFLAKSFEDPTREGWEWLCSLDTQAAWGAATAALALTDIPLVMIKREEFDSFHAAYLAAFGHAARGACPLNEIEYGDIKADPLFQPHRLADLAAFYRAFGLELAADAGERHDHICLELEFMCVLAAKEAYALDQQLDDTLKAQCLDAQRKFLREHLGRWTPAFCRRLAGATSEPCLRVLSEFTRLFIEAECSRFDVRPGSEDLLLRPVDDAAESMCGACGLSPLPPGA